MKEALKGIREYVCDEALFIYNNSYRISFYEQKFSKYVESAVKVINPSLSGPRSILIRMLENKLAASEVVTITSPSNMMKKVKSGSSSTLAPVILGNRLGIVITSWP